MVVDKAEGAEVPITQGKAIAVKIPLPQGVEKIPLSLPPVGRKVLPPARHQTREAALRNREVRVAGRPHLKAIPPHNRLDRGEAVLPRKRPQVPEVRAVVNPLQAQRPPGGSLVHLRQATNSPHKLVQVEETKKARRPHSPPGKGAAVPLHKRPPALEVQVAVNPLLAEREPGDRPVHLRQTPNNLHRLVLEGQTKRGRRAKALPPEVHKAADRVHRGQVRVALPNKTSPPQADSQALVPRNLRLLAHHRPPRDRVLSKGPLQEVPAVVRVDRQVPRVEDRAHKGRDRAALPSKTSLPQAGNLVLEAHNLNRPAHHRPPRDRVPSKGPLQEVPPVVRVHRQVPRVEGRVHRGQVRVALPSKTSPPQADSQALVPRNLRPLALQKLGKGIRLRRIRKKPPQEVLAVVPREGHRQALDNKINSHKALLVQGARKAPPSPGGQKRKGRPKGVVTRESHPRRKS